MTVRFTEQEWENIEKTPFYWHVKKDCPESIRSNIESKLSMLNNAKNEVLTLSDARKIYIEGGV